MRLHRLITITALSALAGPAAAQSGGGFELAWSTIDAGGEMNMSGGSFTLSGGIGQFDAALSGAGDYDLGSGFWTVPPAPSSGCNGADLAEPFGTLDFSDVIAFLGAFSAMEPAADLAPPIGVFDFSDVIAFLGAFGDGCP